MRCIVRASFQSDPAASTTLAQNLQAKGFERIGTGSFEADGVPRETVIAALTGILNQIKHYVEPGRLDHVWIYFDTDEHG